MSRLSALKISGVAAKRRVCFLEPLKGVLSFETEGLVIYLALENELSRAGIFHRSR